MKNNEYEFLVNPTNSIWSPLATRQVPKEHPRLFGDRACLQRLAKDRKDAFARMKAIAKRPLTGSPHPADKAADFGAQISVGSKLYSMALVAAVEEDPAMGRAAVELALEHYVDQPVRVGHVPFGADVGYAAAAYDLCHEHWTDAERKRFHAYVFACRDRNADQETSPFHDGWWGYKMWGFILGLLAMMYESESELIMLYQIDREFRLIAADALRLAGAGGGYPEGFYVNYYMFDWLLACDAMRRCTGADYLAEAPDFYKHRAVASIFEQYPGIRERGSRRPICLGDGRGRFFKVERDAILAANHVLVNHYRDDPAHHAVKAFLNLTPNVGADENAYREFLFFDPTVKAANLKKFKLSHVSEGPGFVYARSSWEEDATYFFFKCGKRFTAHQHLDVGHFFIYKHEELASEGGHYDDFGGNHATNYYLRTIAHNSILVLDPSEKFRCVRGTPEDNLNDGGQAFPWPGTLFRHNGDGLDADAWRRHAELMNIADLLAFEDHEAFLYVAGDCTRAYSADKLERFTRQIVYLRPGTFLIFDRVKAKKAAFKKSWVLHSNTSPTGAGKNFIITNGKGRMFVQTLLPAESETVFYAGDKQYVVQGKDVSPAKTYGVGSNCRTEVSPTLPAREDFFLHVLTTTDAGVEKVPQAAAAIKNGKVVVTLGKTRVTFLTAKVGGVIEINGKKKTLASKITQSGKRT